MFWVAGPFGGGGQTVACLGRRDNMIEINRATF
jgi:hypothetical protein